MRLLAVVAVCVLSAAVAFAGGSRDPKDCEVCIKVMGDIAGRLDAEQRKDRDVVEAAIDSYCAAKDKFAPDSKEKKLCYYVSTVKRDFSQQLMNGASPERICRKLKKKAMEVCELRFPEQIDLKTVDFKKMRTKQLRALLREQFSDPCTGCIEKGDFVKRLEKYRDDEL